MLKRPGRSSALSLLAPLLAGGLLACGNDNNFTQDATSTNTEVRASVYALSGTSPELQSAYEASTNSFVRPIVGQATGATNFEVAFDILPDGKVLLLTVRSIVPAGPSSPQIALLKSVTPYDQIVRAPGSGAYVVDSTAVASAGDTFLIKVVNPRCTYGEPFYGKILIDSVVVPQRRIVVRALTNLNCGGYRSLVAGLPKD